MTTDRLIDDLTSHQWLEGGRGEDRENRPYVMYEKSGFFLFIIEGKTISDGLYGAEWSADIESITVLRHRRDTLSIETENGDDYDITFSEETFEVGCSG